MKVELGPALLARRALVAALLVASAPVAAMQPADVRDLVGARAGAAEGELERRGYAFHHASQGAGASYAYWYNSRSRTCIAVTTRDGRYETVRAAGGHDCGQRGGDGAAAGAAVAALAILGVAALAHRSHHHDDSNHVSDAAHEAAFERGYRDGLYNYPYHNYDRSDAYSSGYQSGVSQRDAEGGHRRGHGAAGGYRRSVQVSDLNGARASSADDELRRRGFRDVDRFQTGTTAYSIWYNNPTRQCLQMTVADGRVYDLRDIGGNPNCR